jgi:hypothetical protein
VHLKFIYNTLDLKLQIIRYKISTFDNWNNRNRIDRRKLGGGASSECTEVKSRYRPQNVVTATHRIELGAMYAGRQLDRLDVCVLAQGFDMVQVATNVRYGIWLTGF